MMFDPVPVGNLVPGEVQGFMEELRNGFFSASPLARRK